MNTNALPSTFARHVRTAAADSKAIAGYHKAVDIVRAVRQIGWYLLVAGLPAIVLAVVAAWAVSAYETPRILPAIAWATGFIFLAFAVESPDPRAAVLSATAVALLVLALLSTWVAAEFVIFAALLVGAWCGLGLVRMLHQSAWRRRWKRCGFAEGEEAPL